MSQGTVSVTGSTGFTGWATLEDLITRHRKALA
jgi:hypothetical protein